MIARWSSWTCSRGNFYLSFVTFESTSSARATTVSIPSIPGALRDTSRFHPSPFPLNADRAIRDGPLVPPRVRARLAALNGHLRVSRTPCDLPPPPWRPSSAPSPSAKRHVSGAIERVPATPFVRHEGIFDCTLHGMKWELTQFR